MDTRRSIVPSGPNMSLCSCSLGSSSPSATYLQSNQVTHADALSSKCSCALAPGCPQRKPKYGSASTSINHAPKVRTSSLTCSCRMRQCTCTGGSCGPVLGQSLRELRIPRPARCHCQGLMQSRCLPDIERLEGMTVGQASLTMSLATVVVVGVDLYQTAQVTHWRLVSVHLDPCRRPLVLAITLDLDFLNFSNICCIDFCHLHHAWLDFPSLNQIISATALMEFDKGSVRSIKMSRCYV